MANIDRLDAEILLAHATGKDRTHLAANPEEELKDLEEESFFWFVEERSRNKPIAYITGKKEFYGREFAVDPAVLIPRPATERLIDVFILQFTGHPSTPLPTPPRLRGAGRMTHDLDTEIVANVDILGDLQEVATAVDVGTGSGCIAVTLACELKDYKIIATDISRDALDIARNNAQQHNVFDRISFLQGDLLEPIKDLHEPFIIVSNPPYIPQNEVLMPDVYDHEPHEALFAGADGGDILRELLKQAKNHPWCRGIMMECKKGQANLLLKSVSLC